MFFHDIPSLLQKNKTKEKNQKTQKNPPNTQMMNPQKQNTMLLK